MTRSSILPPGWAWSSLGEIANIKGGITKGQRRAPDELLRSVPYLRVANVQRGHLDLTDVKEIEATDKEIEELRLVAGDVLFNEGGDRDKLGRGWVWNDELPLCIHQNHVFRARMRAGIMQPKLLSWYGNTFGQKYFLDEGKQTTNLASINMTKLAALPVPIPPPREQTRLVEEIEKQLSYIDAGVAALGRLQTNLKRYRASVLKAACEGKLVPTEAELARAEEREYEPADKLLGRILKERRERWEAEQLAKMKAKGQEPKDDSWRQKYNEPRGPSLDGAPTLPSGWAWASVEQLAPLQPGFAFPSSGFATSGVRLVKGDNVRDGWLSTSSVDHWPSGDMQRYTSFVLRDGDLVLAMDRPVYSSGSRATKVARLDASWDGALLLQRVGRFLAVMPEIRPYVYAFLRSDAFRAHLIMSQKGSQDGKDLPHVSGGVVNSARVPLPPLREQVRIVAEVDRHLSVVDEIDQVIDLNLKRADRLRQAVLRRAFEGKLVPQDPDDEPASVLLERIRAERAAAGAAEGPRKKRPGRSRLPAETVEGGERDG